MFDPPPQPPLVVLSFQKRLVAMHAHTGERAWEYELPKKTDSSRVVVEQGRVLFVSDRSMLCLDYATGALLWSTPLPGSVASDPSFLVYAGCVVLCEIGEAVSLTLEDGSLRWHDDFRGYGICGGAMAAPGVTVPIDRTRN